MDEHEDWRWYDRESVSFLIEGRIKPYVRMTQRSKHVDPQAQEYLASKLAIGLQLKQQMQGREIIPRGIPLAVGVDIEEGVGFHNRDLDNEVKAMLDAGQGVVFEDDRWIDEILAMRYRGQESRASLSVQRLENDPLMPCGHPQSAIVSSDEGTHYCGMCAEEANERSET